MIVINLKKNTAHRMRHVAYIEFALLWVQVNMIPKEWIYTYQIHIHAMILICLIVRLEKYRS